MLQKISSVFVVYRRKTLTGSPDPTHANGTDKPCILFTGGVCLWSGRGVYTPRKTPLGRPPFPRQIPHPCRAPRTDPPGQTPPCAVHAGIRSTSEWYASYWNAFLLKLNIIWTIFIFIFALMKPLTLKDL